MLSESAGIRSFFASIDVFLANAVAKVYSLILSLSDINIVSFFSQITEKIYSLIGIFMCFKVAIVVINYIIDPDKISDKNTGTSKFIVKIVIALALLGTMPNIFKELYEIQRIVLQKNVVGKFVLGNEAQSSINDQLSDLENTSKSISYSIVSSFLNYNASGALSVVFSDCVNIFKVEDTSNLTTVRDIDGCESVTINKCKNFLAPQNSDTERFGKNGNGRTGYYYCKNNTKYPNEVNCGVRDGAYLVDIINTARENYDYKSILSSEILSATENDPVFFGNHGGGCCQKSVSEILESGSDSEKVTCNRSDGDFVFRYDYGISTIALICTLVMLIILSVDVAIRIVKFNFLEVISPIPIISYIDVKESKLFNSWLKMTINTFLDLFIKLFVVFLVTYLLSDGLQKIQIENPIALIFLVIGTIIFAMKCPDFISKLFGLNGDEGVMSLLKNTGKFFIGAGTMVAAGVGGTLSAHANTALNLSKSDNKGKEIVKGLANGVKGGVGSSIRAAGSFIANKGNYQKGMISDAITNRSGNYKKFSDKLETMKANDYESKDVEEAFKKDKNDKYVYDNYKAYKSAMELKGKHAISEEKYEEYAKIYHGIDKTAKREKSK